jgi:hypothetical protein
MRQQAIAVVVSGAATNRPWGYTQTPNPLHNCERSGGGSQATFSVGIYQRSLPTKQFAVPGSSACNYS